ncbi:hypothetical protein MMC21_005733 [Puttea exsequens]|nr:hypothetical protein [Puttea exsequens]
MPNYSCHHHSRTYPNGCHRHYGQKDFPFPCEACAYEAALQVEARVCATDEPPIANQDTQLEHIKQQLLRFNSDIETLKQSRDYSHSGRLDRLRGTELLKRRAEAMKDEADNLKRRVWRARKAMAQRIDREAWEMYEETWGNRGRE